MYETTATARKAHGKEASDIHWKTRLTGRVARSCAFCLTLGVTASVIASPAAAPKSPEGTQPSTSSRHSWLQIGKASWYGRQFQGRKTATGESFDMNAFTCAHRTLPLGSWVRVTNLRNRKFTFLRVNDRGPYSGNFIVDLSYAAAKKLGIGGLAKVRVEPVTSAEVSSPAPQIARVHFMNDPAVVSIQDGGPLALLSMPAIR